MHITPILFSVTNTPFYEILIEHKTVAQLPNSPLSTHKFCLDNFVCDYRINKSNSLFDAIENDIGYVQCDFGGSLTHTYENHIFVFRMNFLFELNIDAGR